MRVPNADWIAADRKGLTICDATSAAFAQPLDFPKLDVVTFSWQKALGGEAAHGMIVLSPRAVARLESHTPSWPIPKVFRLTKGGKFNEDPFEGGSINTPSMLCVEDWLDTLQLGEVGRRPQGADRARRRQRQGDFRLGGAHAVDRVRGARSRQPLQHLGVPQGGRSRGGRSCRPTRRPSSSRASPPMLEKEGVAYDIDAYRDAPPGLRIWCGATVEASDVEALTLWLDWAYGQAKDALRKAA